MTECGPDVTGACTGHYLTTDLWGPPGTGLLVLIGAAAGFGLAWWIGMRTGKDWLKVCPVVIAFGALAHSRSAEGSKWLVLVGVVGLYFAAWRTLRLRIPA